MMEKASSTSDILSSKRKKKKSHRNDRDKSSSDSESSSSNKPSPKKKRKKEKKGSSSKKLHKKDKKKRKHKKAEGLSEEEKEDLQIGPSLDAVEESRSMRPMTKEEWEAQQNVTRYVVDPETGRRRLVKGDGEILEEIVSRDRHKEINKRATAADGAFFQKNVYGSK